MLLSAEVRWFWEGPRADLHRWFRDALPPPGGGGERTDTYLIDRSQAELGIKSRGRNPGLEIKSLVKEGGTVQLGPLAAPVQTWTKLATTVLRLDGLPAIAVHKRRWVRRYATTGSGLRELALGADEQPISGEPWPVQGCSVELTDVRLERSRGTWTTLGLEAFGSLDRIEESLWAVVRHYQTNPPPDGSGLALSYPQWLARTIKR